MNDNVIEFPGSKLDIEFTFDDDPYVDSELETVKTMLEVQANGIIASSDNINWGHIFDASMHLLVSSGIKSGFDPETIKHILKSCDVECFDE